MSRRLAYLSNGAVLLCALVLTSCSRETNRNTPSVRPPVPVVVGKVGTMDLPVRIQSVGTVQPYSTVAVRSQITGPILEVHFQEGQEVREGDLLFTIDPRPWQAALNQARANLQRNEAQLINARLQFLRTSNLFAIQIASQADYEAAEAAYQTLIAAERKAVIDKATSAASDDAVVSARRGLQDVILGVKLEAKALYGPSSDQVAALGLKKKSEKAKKSKKAKVKKTE
mgnify:CR=1 FL=1